eukprot:CAMPEP_0202386328 /NCGR_PEP_ID=MMETSP1127-20130417/65772_1 /ASSEMBLY_ACC=CAM_ASM_000462 /TAXON_ID=3047 /ORGANISM="Dunaliella tertiolecta, Strain CCMP1320" /LENGTH=44 /DNA_ID= /DNA_START= /DNA_END= /DNA_ORIENTATION=
MKSYALPARKDRKQIQHIGGLRTEGTTYMFKNVCYQWLKGEFQP